MKRVALIPIMMVSILFADPGVTKENVLEWLSNSAGFEKNLGQVTDFDKNPVANLFSRINLKDLSIFITDEGISFVMYQTEESANEPGNILHYARFDLEPIAGNIRKENIVYEDELPGYTNYYYPSCSDGILFVKSYRKVRVKDIYPGIDWVFRIEDGRLHHEFEILPSANYEDIKLKVKWADLIVAEDGKRIRFQTPLGEIVDGEVFAYEENNPPGIQASYRKIAEDIIGFEVNNFTGKEKLIIDPPLSLLWATYYGGDANDGGYSITTDGAGNIFVTGYTGSSDFPTQNPGGGAYYQGTIGSGNDDAFILKFETSIGIEEQGVKRAGSSIIVPLFFKDRLTLRFINATNEPSQLRIYDALGNSVYNRVITGSGIITLKEKGISELPVGVYLVKVATGNRSVEEYKVIKLK